MSLAYFKQTRKTQEIQFLHTIPSLDKLQDNLIMLLKQAFRHSITSKGTVSKTLIGSQN